ncbi:DUF4041 domain-containing protein [Jidongwangia harbinensis]|uniref:DUF4041 domain-containing protein n=1 Tax=Jidongwangia harbinensis TaxID=2878561 RepID=UPI001CD9A335|nr:DUF4041 domain-containing protein [Jidongwangia harbinensis]MCA2216025.1 DUF4041 domain-containing protein [Jidongwangia harbinensis]
MQRLGVLSAVELERYRERVRQETADEAARSKTQLAEQIAQTQARVGELMRQEAEAHTRLAQVRQQVVVTEETAILQEVGVYEYRHPLSDAVAYQAALARIQDRIKRMARADGGAVQAARGWTVNGSEAQGRTMIRDFSKLMLRAYNAEADNLVRGMKPYKLDSAVDRLGKVATAIARLGKTMDIRRSRKSGPALTRSALTTSTR